MFIDLVYQEHEGSKKGLVTGRNFWTGPIPKARVVLGLTTRLYCTHWDAEKTSRIRTAVAVRCEAHR